MQLDRLNALDRDAAARTLLPCCGSPRWAERMAAARPFASVEAMAATAERIWWALDRTDWLDAFAAHPRIGGADGGAPSRSSQHQSWSTAEQAQVAEAAAGERAGLVERNREYEARFGYIFIVCATGKSAGEMLRILETRLPNDSETELRVAAEEQRKITRLRLEKLIAGEQNSGT